MIQNKPHIYKLPKSVFPEDGVYKQVMKLKLPMGGVLPHTYKAAVYEAHFKRYKIKDAEKTPVRGAPLKDLFYDEDEYVYHEAYYIKDAKGKIVSWALVLIGNINNEPCATIQLFTKPSTRGQGHASILFKRGLEIIQKYNVKTIFYYGCNRNKFFFKKMKERYVTDKGIEMLNIYTNILKFANTTIKQ